MRAGNFHRNFHLLLAFGFCLCLATPVIHSFGYQGTGLFLRALFSAAAIISFALVHKYPLASAASVVFLLVVAALAYQVTPESLERMYETIYSYLAASPHLWPAVIITAAALLFYLLLFTLKNPAVLLFAAGAAVFVPLWYMYVDSAYPASVFYGACWLLLLSYKSGHRYWGGLLRDGEAGARQGHPEDSKRLEKFCQLRQVWLVYTVTVLFMALAMALILPKDFGPLPWRGLQSRATGAFPVLYELRGGEDIHVRGDGSPFSLYSAGFQETSRLGGPLRQDTTVLLEVRGQGGAYLKGSVKDHYSGRSWATTTGSGEPADFHAPPEALLDYLETADLRIVHLRLRTKTVFSIHYPLEIRGLGSLLHVDANSGISLPESVPRGREYRVKGLLLAYRGNFAAMETAEETPGMAPFLQLPPGLPPRVKELALEIAGDYRGNYDKMKALEGYLRRSYRYNTETPPLPADRDFVDFFLFDLAEGYCSYFASSLAVLARAAGVPTRYVEGFNVPEEPDEAGFFQVAGIHAHAWVEGYIPGIGWLPFEATPPFRTADSLPRRQETAEREVPAPPQEGPPPPPHAGDPFLDIFPDYPAPPMPAPGEGLSAGSFFSSLARFFLAAALAIALLFSLMILLRFLHIKKTLRSLKGLEPALRAIGYYNLTLSFLERLGDGKYPGETPREYCRRIINRVFTWGLNFNEISEGMNLILYSGREEVPPRLAEDTERFFRFIFERYLNRVGKWSACREILLQGKYFSRTDA